MPASSSEPLRRSWFVLDVLLVLMGFLTLAVPYFPAEFLPDLEILPLLSLVWAVLLVWPAWTWARRKRWLISSLHLALAATLAPNLTFPQAAPDREPDGIRVLSLNAAALDYRRHLQLAFRALIAQQRPDIVCIQEALLTERSTAPDSLRAWQEATGLRYLAFLPYVANGDNELGMAIFSRYPMKNQGLVWRGYPAHPNNDIHYADISINGRAVRVYSLHLRSYNLGGHGQGLLDSTEQAAVARGRTYGLRRMPRAWAVQRRQLDSLAAHVAGWTRPAIVAGDWNNPPFSGIYQRTRRLLPGFQDAWREAGTGSGATHTLRGVPLRIDYLFASREFRVLHCRTIANPYSDHRMVLSIVTLR